MTSLAAGTTTPAHPVAARRRRGLVIIRVGLEVEREDALDLLRRRGHKEPGEPTNLVVATIEGVVVAVAVAYGMDLESADFATEPEWGGIGLGGLLGRELGRALCCGRAS